MKFEEEEEEEEEQQQHFHVLAVDDSFVDRKLLERLLKISSYQVTCVESGNKALEYLGLLDHDNPQPSSQQEGMKVNLIMTDYCMPGMSGYDLLKRVKGSSWKDVPVVVMSSENVPSRVTMCLEGGAEEFMLKPLQLSDVKKIQSYLLKSMDHSYTNGKIGLIDNGNHNTNNCSRSSSNSDATSDVNSSTDKTDDSSSNDDNSCKCNKNYSKRKAMSPNASERRPKIKV